MIGSSLLILHLVAKSPTICPDNFNDVIMRLEQLNTGKGNGSIK